MPADQWLQIYGRTIDDTLAAIDWALSASEHHSIGFDIIIATAALWFQLSLMDEYRERLQGALERLNQSSDIDLPRKARLRIALGHAVWYAAGARPTQRTRRLAQTEARRDTLRALSPGEPEGGTGGIGPILRIGENDKAPAMNSPSNRSSVGAAFIRAVR